MPGPLKRLQVKESCVILKTSRDPKEVSPLSTFMTEHYNLTFKTSKFRYQLKQRDKFE